MSAVFVCPRVRSSYRKRIEATCQTLTSVGALKAEVLTLDDSPAGFQYEAQVFCEGQWFTHSVYRNKGTTQAEQRVYAWLRDLADQLVP